MTLIFLDIGGGEILLVLVVIIVVYGPSKIPEIARKLGKGIAEVRKASSEIKKEIDDEVEKLDHNDSTKHRSGVVKEKENGK